MEASERIAELEAEVEALKRVNSALRAKVSYLDQAERDAFARRARLEGAKKAAKLLEG